MTSKQWTLIAVAVVLGGIGLYLNRDWFARDNIQISHRLRTGIMASMGGGGRFRRNAPNAKPAPNIFFEFDRKLNLTDVRVVAFSDFQTNKYPMPLWHMTSESNSLPTRGFMYGSMIPGMRPNVKGAAPEPLEPDAKYRLLLSAGKFKAYHDFTIAGEKPQ